MISPNLLALGVGFYDVMREHGADDYSARRLAICYMRRKAEDPGDAMPFFEALAAELADRAHARILTAESAIVQLAGTDRT